MDPIAFRRALLELAPAERDAWVDRELGIDGVPDDGPALPRGCVPYLPCGVDVLLRMIDRVPIGADDVFIDVGGGLGRAAAIVQLLTGAGAIALEIQPHLAASARALAARLALPRFVCVEGDALALMHHLALGTVFFFYCPFSGERLARVLAELDAIAQSRRIHVCCVDTPLPACAWLERVHDDGELSIHRSVGVRDPAGWVGSRRGGGQGRRW